MSVLIETSNNITLAQISGDLDHHTAKIIRNQIDKELNAQHPKCLILDFSKVSFMDSSGIGLVMGRYKLMQDISGDVIISRPPDYIKKVMKLAGIDKITTITDNPQKIFAENSHKSKKELDKIETKSTK